MGSEALSEAVNASKKKKKKGRAGKEAKQNRRRTIGPFSVRASVKKVEGGELLTLRNMFVAFHHPESGGPNSSSIKLAGPGMLSLLFVIVAVGFASFWLAGLLQFDVVPRAIAVTVLIVCATLAERFWAHRRLDVQVVGGNFAIYRNGRKKPFVVGNISKLSLGVSGVKSYQRIRFLFPLEKRLSGVSEHDIYLQPVPSDTADIVDAYARKMGVEG